MPNLPLVHFDLRRQVIDEADRLLAQSFQDWLVQVLAATRPPSMTERVPCVDTMSLDALIPDAVAPAWSHTLPYADISPFPTERKESSCQKLLFSATLTRDPGKIAALELRNPKYFIIQDSKSRTSESGVLNVVMEKFSMPSTLMVIDTYDYFPCLLTFSGII
jgi:ATP-dependent RNA helicase DDX51/DBP6